MGRGSSRNFQAALLLFLTALVLLGIALRTTVREGLNDQAFQKLENDANVLSELTAAYHADGGIHSIQFIINLDLTARVSGADAVLAYKIAGRDIVPCIIEPGIPDTSKDYRPLF